MFHRGFFGGLLLAMAQLACAVQSQPSASQVSQPPVNAGLEEAAPDPEDELATALERLLVDHGSLEGPGCSLTLRAAEREVITRHLGLAQVEHQQPISDDSRFYLASLSKQFTALTQLVLESRGGPKRSDLVRTHIPELAEIAGDMQIADLIHHTSGLRDHLQLMALAGYDHGEHYDTGAALRMLFRQSALAFAPGEAHAYSNANYLVLAEILRRATGRPLSELAQEHIFGPLGMDSTFYLRRTQQVIPGLAEGYRRQRPTKPLERAPARSTAVGPGGVYSNSRDLDRWLAALEHDDLRLGQPGLRQQLFTTGHHRNGRKLPYAHGLVRGEFLGHPLYGHTGDFIGYRTSLLVFPEAGLGVVALCNHGAASPRELTRAAAALVLSGSQDHETTASTEPNVPGLGAASHAAHLGRYLDFTGGHLEVLAEGEQMHVRWQGRLEAVVQGEGNLLNLARSGLRLRFGADGRSVSSHVDILHPMGHVIARATRVDAGPSPVEASERASLIGDYESAELDVRYRIQAMAGGLSLQVGRRGPVPLTRRGPDTYAHGSKLIKFGRGRRGQVTGFVLDAARISGVGFVRR